jgi:hypothetical protein
MENNYQLGMVIAIFALAIAIAYAGLQLKELNARVAVIQQSVTTIQDAYSFGRKAMNVVTSLSPQTMISTMTSATANALINKYNNNKQQ